MVILSKTWIAWQMVNSDTSIIATHKCDLNEFSFSCGQLRIFKTYSGAYGKVLQQPYCGCGFPPTMMLDNTKEGRVGGGEKTKIKWINNYLLDVIILLSEIKIMSTSSVLK